MGPPPLTCMEKNMTRKIVPFIVCLLWGAVAIAGEFDKVQFQFVNAPTGVAASVSQASGKLRGYVDRLDIALTEPLTNTLQVVITAVNPDSGLSTTIFSALRGTNDTFYPRVGVHDTAGAAAFTDTGARMLLLDDVVTMTVSNALRTNQTVKAVIIYERP